MFNPFPELLMFSFFAPMLLRIAAAGALFYSARYIWRERNTVAHIKLPIIGTPGPGVIAFVAFVLFATSCALIFGYLTQYAAILGMIVAAKYVLLSKRLGTVVPLSRGTAALLFVICLSLLITGAGALAIDLPL